MAKQTFTTGQVLTAAQMTSLQQTAMGGGSPSTKTASYVLVAADAGTVIQMNAAGSTTITVNTALFSAGDSVQIQNIGAGVCTITAGTATVNTAGSLALSQWEGGFLYFTSASSAIFFDVVQSGGMTNPMTTAGDIIYGGASGTPTRLAIGSTGQVLTVSSGNPAWATAASSGGMTLLQSLSLSGSSVTSSTLSSAYKQFVVYFKGASIASGNQYFNFRLNSDTGSNYGWTYLLYNNTDAVGISIGNADTKCRMGLVDVVGTDYGVMKGILTITRPSDTDYIFWNFNGWNRSTAPAANQYSISAGTYDSSAAITSITLYPDSSTFDGGTAEIYGVN